MKKFKFSIMFLVAALSIAALGSAALSTISFERSVSAGQVMVDTDPNVAIQISNQSIYTDLVKADANGKVSIHLNAAVDGGLTKGFNTDAIFTIGSKNSAVIRIKNNSDMAVTVSMVGDAITESAILLIPTSNSSNVIGVGASSDFYFVINTNGQAASTQLNAVLKVASN